MAEETVQTEEKKGGGKSMMIILVVLIVVLLLAVGGLAYFLMSKGIFDDKPQQIAPTAVEQQQAQTTDPKENIGETFRGTVDSLVLNITDAKGRVKLMKLSFTLRTKEPQIEAILEQTKAEIIDSVIRQVSARSSEELLTVGGKAMLKEEMLDEINNILNDSIPEGDEERVRNPVLDIFFTSFVIK